MSYLGSKAGAGVYQAIIALMPPHDTYVELFAGSGAVLQRKGAAAQSYAVDLDKSALALIPDMDGLTKVHGDAFDFLDSFDYAGSGRVLIYADPPYMHCTRTSKARYRHELDDADHVSLLQMLLLSPARVILSGYPSQLYADLLSGWRTCEFQAMTRGGVRTEKLWYNFEPSAVHYATHAGKDYIDRQRIKRKAARWAQMYAAMPPGEQMAVLASILAVRSAQTPATLNECFRPEQIRMSVPPAPSPSSTVGPGDHSGQRLLQLQEPGSPRPSVKPGSDSASSTDVSDYESDRELDFDADPKALCKCSHPREYHDDDGEGHDYCFGMIYDTVGIAHDCPCTSFTLPDSGATKPGHARSAECVHAEAAC